MVKDIDSHRFFPELTDGIKHSPIASSGGLTLLLVPCTCPTGTSHFLTQQEEPETSHRLKRAPFMVSQLQNLPPIVVGLHPTAFLPSLPSSKTVTVYCILSCCTGVWL